MNILEKSLVDASKVAQIAYTRLSRGWWLSHGPESFLMSTIATEINRKTKSWVFLDASPKKIRREIKEPIRRGRPLGNQGKRFDLVIWKKSTNKVRAVIEIKRAYTVGMLYSDRKKLSNYLSQENYPISAYLLAYTEAKGTFRERTLIKRKNEWPSRLGCDIVCYAIDCKDDEFGWAVFLLKIR
jgi:hypothetical protein